MRSGEACALADRVLEVEDLLRLRWVSGAAIRPDGAEGVYTETWVDPEENAYRSRLMRVRRGEDPAPFTAGGEDSAPAYRPDGAEVAFLSKRGGQSQVWAMPVDGGEARQLTAIDGGVSAFAWSPNGGPMALVCPLETEGVVPERSEDARKKRDAGDPERRHTRGVRVITELTHKMDGVGYFGERRAQLVLLDAVPGPGSPPADGPGAARQLTHGPYGVGDVSWAPDGGALYFASRRRPDYDRDPWQGRLLYRLDLARAGAVPERLTPDEDFSVLSARVSPDGKRIALVATRPSALGYDNATVYLLEPDGTLKALGAQLDRPMTDLSLSDVMTSGYGGLTWLADGKTVTALISDCARTHWVALDTVLDGVRTLAGGDRRIAGYAVSKDGGQALLVTTDPTCPCRVQWWSAPEGVERTVAEPSREALLGVAIPAPVAFTAAAPGGPDLDGWILPPARGGDGPWPAVLEIHGGPMMMYAHAFFLEFQVLAARGYAVVYGNPRGSMGYGEAFGSAIRERWGDLDYADVTALIDGALRKEPRLDPDRLAVAGGSYGGYMTNWVVGHTDRFKAAVTMRSVVDWRAMVGTGDGGPAWTRRAGGKAPWQDDTWYREQSPITYVERIVTPLLIENQEGDLRCPIEQGEILYSAVKWLGKAPVKFVRYPEEFHGMSRNGKPWHRVHRLRMMLDWLGRYVLGAAPDEAVSSPAERTLAAERAAASAS